MYVIERNFEEFWTITGDFLFPLLEIPASLLLWLFF